MINETFRFTSQRRWGILFAKGLQVASKKLLRKKGLVIKCLRFRFFFSP